MMFEGFRQAKFSTGEAEIDYVTAGDGPPLLLLHGFPQTKAMWAEIASELAHDHTVVAADLRGYGDSSKPENGQDCANYAFRALANDQVALMRHLGHDRFHAIGHDRGARTVHRMTLDHPETVLSMTVMDIVPTRVVFDEGGPEIAHAYYHWFFLAQPHPFPETLIGHDPDLYFETCLTGWGPDGLAAFGPAQLAEYRRCWREPEAIRAMCADYRAAWHVDLPMDRDDRERKVTCPTLVLHGAHGIMEQRFDVAAEWRKCCTDVTARAIDGGHFFIDTNAPATLEALRGFLSRATAAT